MKTCTTCGVGIQHGHRYCPPCGAKRKALRRKLESAGGPKYTPKTIDCRILFALGGAHVAARLTDGRALLGTLAGNGEAFIPWGLSTMRVPADRIVSVQVVEATWAQVQAIKARQVRDEMATREAAE